MKQHIFFFILTVTIFSCQPSGKTEKHLLTLLPPSETNVDFINQLTETEDFNIIQYLYFNNGAGVAAGDINNDGLIDLFFTSNQGPNRLYLNKGGMKFEDITERAGVAGEGDWKTGVTMVDINGDGLLDIYVCQVGKYKTISGRNQLFINQGDLTFKEEAKEYGLDFQGYSTQAAFFDYDMDGDLDMYLMNHSVHSSYSFGGSVLRLEEDPLAGDKLFRNDVIKGKRFFTDVTAKAGIYSSQIGYGLGINVSDINNDGWPDIYISNDFHEDDYLYINNGDGTFTERFREYMRHTTRSSMGNDVADFNNDGLLDVIVLDMLPEEKHIRVQAGGEDDYEVYLLKIGFGYGYQFVRNNLQLNLGDGLFSEIGRLSGVYATDWSWGPLFCDIDNDGYKDIFIANGIYRRANDLNYVKFLIDNEYFSAEHNKDTPDRVLYEKMSLYPYYNYLYRNNGDLTFTNMAREWGINTRNYSNGSAYADLDNDGDLDLITNNINEAAYIYRNNSSENHDNHFLSVSLKGKGMNKFAIGTRVTIYHDGQIQVVEQSPTRGFMSSSLGPLHFGLGKSKLIDSLVVRWPDLTTEVIKNVPANQFLSLDANNANKKFTPDDISNKSLLVREVDIPGLDYHHKENQYYDLHRDFLVPHTLLSEGPALAIADINGDGLDDIFVGSAKGQPSALYIQQDDGSFQEKILPVFTRDRNTEDVDAVFFDANGDGYNDLYIVRGGCEVAPGDPLLSDLLLINDGTGEFRESEKGSLPFTANNGSRVVACDFDNDGDIDLFVGSRSVPGAYGISPNHILLENDGKGNFRDVMKERMKNVKKPGMITDACWVDYDNDGDKDLILVGEWMKITVLRNDNGIFRDATSSAGLDDTSGWWNTIHAIDINNDGHVDLVAGNLGLNNKMKASVTEPVIMYLNDFDGNGTLDQIICAYEDGVSYPFAQVDELKKQVTDLDDKYPYYSDFAGKTAKDIFGRKAINRSIKRKAVMFESCVFLNNGKGKFEIQALPLLAQFSPVRDILAQDLDRDGKTDLVLVGNDFTAKPNYGRHDASYGWCLLADSANNFRGLFPSESGLRVNGDARKIKTLESGGKQYLVVAVNDEKLQVFECLK